MIADALANWSNYVILRDHWVADLARFVIAVIAALTAVLLARLYHIGRTGRMNRLAGLGATGTYFVVAWAQVIALAQPDNNLTTLNLAVLVAVTLSLLGTVQAMDVTLFTGRRPGPTPAVKAQQEILRIGEVVDAIDHAVNNRAVGQPTMSQDIAVSRLRDETADAAALDLAAPVEEGTADRAAGATAEESSRP